MDDFLYILKMQLMERLPQSEVDRQIARYEDYIQEQLDSGLTLEQVMRRIGDPMKVGELVLEDYDRRAEEKKQAVQEQQADLGSMTEDEINAQIQNPKKGFHAHFSNETGWDIRLGRLKLNSWYGTLLILGVVLAVFILLSELTGA